MNRTPIRFSKLSMQEILSQNSVVKETLPDTKRLTQKNFWAMLNQYNVIVLKKENYGKGIGILKVKKLGEDKYEVHREDERRVFTNKGNLYFFVIDNTKGTQYLVQQHVALAKINDSPFDIRVIVQRKFGTDNWVVTGKYAKASAKGFFKTNLAAGGRVFPVEEAIRLSTIDEKIDISALLSKIDKVSLEATKQACATKKFKNWLIWGMDVGIEDNGRIFFFEANEVPGTKGFNRLKDSSMRRRIKKIKAYNRKMRRRNRKKRK
ncbi:YheC/YheD family protein [Alteribacter keqinensis]|uniref:YheC/D like ATP-grasp n=1 Tax=Alteribacter keqinensis TaxID=2483800 RepID=A0A3M7TNN0_9BACI|nr:YheC/YheD family protein [Alteribacter keqinensis]RNA66215.1 hypothetical protein EBO34_18980 [Alteribacter keqinensis]